MSLRRRSQSLSGNMKFTMLSLLYICFVCCVASETQFYRSGNILVEIKKLPVGQRCFVYGDRDIVKEVLESAPSSATRVISRKEIYQLIERCPTDVNEIHSGFIRKKRSLGPFSVIYPGTKWCGIGNIADNHTDLGSERETDSCCREHDLCPDYVLPWHSKLGWKNYGLITKFHCDCDTQFYNCLKNTTETAAEKVGNIYFNWLELTCYKSVKTDACVQKGWWFTCKKRGEVVQMKTFSNKRF